jgi:hypothetical protein
MGGACVTLGPQPLVVEKGFVALMRKINNHKDFACMASPSVL